MRLRFLTQRTLSKLVRAIAIMSWLGGNFLVMQPVLSVGDNATPINPAVSPQNSTASSLNITWASGGGVETYYRIQKSIDGLGYPAKFFEVKVPTTNFTYDNLLPNQGYWFRVRSADNIALDSPYVAFGPAYTLANNPAIPVVEALNTNTLNFSIGAGDNNPATTMYFMREMNSGLYVTNNATLGSKPYVASAVAWQGTKVFGLTPNTEYKFVAIAKNEEGTNSNGSPTAERFTLAETPAALSVAAITPTSLKFSFQIDNNPAYTQYALHEVTRDLWLTDQGTLSAQERGWNTRSVWRNVEPTVSGLLPNATYIFEVIAKNGNSVPTAFSAHSTVTTAAQPALVPPQPAPAPANPTPTPNNPGVSPTKQPPAVNGQTPIKVSKPADTVPASVAPKVTAPNTTVVSPPTTISSPITIAPEQSRWWWFLAIIIPAGALVGYGVGRRGKIK
ncbi:MAG: fibronectin type III domain-containing protein [Candidatus Magasanikbacteria bacterium]|nr:fibronectin type III domain-containing protein [Candidatus Magasanikbacteria bacterium]